MFDSQIAVTILITVAAGAVAYVLLYPILSGEARAAKRQKALVASPIDRRERIAAVSRKEQVAQTLKEIEQRQKDREKVGIEQRLARAGVTWSKQGFYMGSVALGLLLGLAILVTLRNPLIAIGAAFVGGFGIPRWVLGYLARKRITAFVLELPNAIDVVVRGIRSGLPLGDCLRIVASEAGDPVKTEFRLAVEAQAVGMTVPEAVGKIYERVPVAEANFFAIVLAIQAKAGGNLSEALGNLSRVLRERRKMGDKVKAMSMEAKASAAIIAALPFIVAILTYLSSPDYMTLLWTTRTGKIAMGGGLVWMSIGIFVMKKMINFKV
ncbi:type II secretion system F family protein [Microvirga massiliensis]|uniref:type II secretion system F family protein n=1 Tax=Microvirga massiliensis TaxID=1033741 RepID=UPI00062B8576|nr:type II secretion system F family protein [Microvirga massiliensis]